MAFKLLIEITNDGAIDVSHEGNIDPIILLGAIRSFEHNVLMTIDAQNFLAAQEAPDGAENKNEEEGQEQ